MPYQVSVLICPSSASKGLKKTLYWLTNSDFMSSYCKEIIGANYTITIASHCNLRAAVQPCNRINSETMASRRCNPGGQCARYTTCSCVIHLQRVTHSVGPIFLWVNLRASVRFDGNFVSRRQKDKTPSSTHTNETPRELSACLFSRAPLIAAARDRKCTNGVDVWFDV